MLHRQSGEWTRIAEALRGIGMQRLSSEELWIAKAKHRTAKEERMEREKAQKALIKACAQILKCADTILDDKEIEKANGIALRTCVNAEGETASDILFWESFRIVTI